MPPKPKDQVEHLRSSIDVLVRVFKITDSLDVDPTVPKLNPPDVQTLIYVGDNPGCMSSDAGAFLGTVPTTTTAIIDRLVKRGLVLRERSDENRRIVALTLTPDGRKVADKILDQQRDHCRQMLAKLSAAERKAFLAAMGKIVDGLG